MISPRSFFMRALCRKNLFLDDTLQVAISDYRYRFYQAEEPENFEQKQNSGRQSQIIYKKSGRRLHHCFLREKASKTFQP